MDTNRHKETFDNGHNYKSQRNYYPLHIAKSWMHLLKILNPKTDGSIHHLQPNVSKACVGPLIINHLHKGKKEN